MKFTTLMSTAAVFGSVASVELQYQERTGEELDTYSNCIQGGFYGDRGQVDGVEVTHSPEECAEAKWAEWIRQV